MTDSEGSSLPSDFTLDSDPEPEPDQTLSVSSLTHKIAQTLSNNFNSKLSVEGELSNCKQYGSRLYFTLKDDGAQLSGIMWNFDNCPNSEAVTNGTKVVVSGRLDLYKQGGRYNLNAQDIKPIGEGELNRQYMQTKDRYAKLGYFDQDHKKALPQSINKIGVVTAASGAAFKDFLYVLKSNGFSGEVLIKNCTVQGSTCPAQVAAAIKDLDSMGLDVIVVTRGGGSFEDLFGFSDSKVLEALFNAHTPTVSAIGHEVDFMLSDFVADVRAPTPSVAGEVVSQGVIGVEIIDGVIDQLHNEIVHRLNSGTQTVFRLRNYLRSPVQLVDKLIGNIDSLQNNLTLGIKNKIAQYHSQLNGMTHRMNQQEDQASVLQKGYAQLFCEGVHLKDSKLFKKHAKKGKKLKIRFHDKEIEITVN